MKVKELKELLNKYDDETIILLNDKDGAFDDIRYAELENFAENHPSNKYEFANERDIKEGFYYDDYYKETYKVYKCLVFSYGYGY